MTEGVATKPGLRLALLAGVCAALALSLAPPSAADHTQLEAGRSTEFLTVTVETRGDLVPSGGTFPVDVLVRDQWGIPVPGAAVLPFAAHGTLSDRTVFTGVDGRARFTFTAVTDVALSVTIQVKVIAEGYALEELSLPVTVLPPPAKKPVPVVPAVGVTVGAAVVAALAATEAGRLGLFNLFLFPLYSRLRREEVLDHFVRGQIYGYIQSHPGEHYNRMRDDLKITNGTLSHHLRTLEMQGFVKSRRDGIYRRFYPVEMTIPQEQGQRLSDLQIRLLEILKRTTEGVSQSELAVLLGVSQQTVSYNLRVLSRQGVVRAVKAGRQRRYYVMEGLDA